MALNVYLVLHRGYSLVGLSYEREMDLAVKNNPLLLRKHRLLDTSICSSATESWEQLAVFQVSSPLFSLSSPLSTPFSLSSTYLCYQVGFCASVRWGYRTIWTEAPRRLSQIKTQPVKSAKETISTFNLTLPSPAFQKEKKGLLLIRLASSGRT